MFPSLAERRRLSITHVPPRSRLHEIPFGPLTQSRAVTDGVVVHEKHGDLLYDHSIGIPPAH